MVSFVKGEMKFRIAVLYAITTLVSMSCKQEQETFLVEYSIHGSAHKYDIAFKDETGNMRYLKDTNINYIGRYFPAFPNQGQLRLEFNNKGSDTTYVKLGMRVNYVYLIDTMIYLTRNAVIEY